MAASKQLAAASAIALLLVAAGITWLVIQQSDRDEVASATAHPAPPEEPKPQTNLPDVSSADAIPAAPLVGDPTENTEAVPRRRAILTESESRERIAGTDVYMQLSRDSEMLRHTATTNERGELWLPPLALGIWTASIQCHGYVPTTRSVEVTSSPTRAMIWALRADRTLKGRVVNESGEPVAATIRLTGLDTQVLRNARTQADATGFFDAAGLSPGAWRLNVTHPGYQPRRLELELPADDVEIVLSSDPGFTVTVVDENDTPVRDAKVSLRARNSGNPTARTNADGSVRLKGVALDDDELHVLIRVEHSSFPGVGKRVSTAQLREGLRLTLAPNIEFGGRVVDAGGNPVRGAAVTLAEDGIAGAKTIRTISSGEFLFRSLAPGKYTLRAELAGVGSVSARKVRLPLKDENFELVLDAEKIPEVPAAPVRPPEAGKLTVNVVSSEALEDVRVELESGQPGISLAGSRYSASRSKTSFRRLRPGTYTVLLKKRSGETLAVKEGVRVEAGRTTHIDMRSE